MITEADTCRKYVLPKLYASGWSDEQISEQKSFTDGRIVPVGEKGRRQHPKRADYLLRYTRDLTIAVVEKSTHDTRKLETTNLLEVTILVPSLSDQRRIVAELVALQAQVDGLKKLQAETAAELDAMLPSILDKAFKGELGLRWPTQITETEFFKRVKRMPKAKVHGFLSF